MPLSVPFIGWLGPHNVSYANVDWLMCRKGWHLVGQERLLHHCIVVAVVWVRFPETREIKTLILTVPLGGELSILGEIRHIIFNDLVH